MTVCLTISPTKVSFKEGRGWGEAAPLEIFFPPPLEIVLL